MPTVSTYKKQAGALERFMGEDAMVISRQTVAVSTHVRLEWIEASLRDRDEDGMLCFFPVDDRQFSVQLCYIGYGEPPSLDATICAITFLPGFFDQYPPDVILAAAPFRFDSSTELRFPVCGQARYILEQLRQETAATPFAQALQHHGHAMHLLRRALDCIAVPFAACQVPACRFLAHESEREKIREARQILELNVSQTYTIRELSRKVAMNECYLKKGFKALTGKTIHDYQQELRITRAKELLRNGETVTGVAAALGYSSISHFSASFKRITGMKPCELLA